MANFVAVVTYGTTSPVQGVVQTAGEDLWVAWPDGGADMVYRDTRGWLWDEYGETRYTSKVRVGWGANARLRPVEKEGTRLHVVSRSKKTGARILRSF